MSLPPTSQGPRPTTSQAFPAGEGISTTPTASTITAPTDVANLLQLFSQQLALQQQQTAHMMAILNGLSAQFSHEGNIPNTQGWPPTSTAAPSLVYTSPSLTHTSPAVSGAAVPPNQVPQVHLTSPFMLQPGHQAGHTLRMPVSTSLVVGGVGLSGGGQAAPKGAGLVSGGHNSAATDADTEDVDSTAGGYNHRSRGRSRQSGVPQSSRSVRSSRRVRSRSPSTDVDDPNDGYALNRERNETSCKSIPLKSFSISNKDQDFPIWIQQFEEAVNRVRNPHSQRRHYNYCLQWLPGSLETDAYAIWCECVHAKSDWIELKRELEEKFEDPAFCKEWRTNPKALMWNEGNESLQSFASKVKRMVNIYDAELAVTNAAKANNYCTRFMNGMPDDYIQNLNLNMPSKNQRLEKALEICVRFQAYKRSATPTRGEVGASVTFQEPTVPSRVVKAETDIRHLSNRLDTMEEIHPNNKPPQQTSLAGGSSRHPVQKNLCSARSRPPSQDGDRWSMLAASLDNGISLLSEAESDSGNLDDTVADFIRMEQMGEREKLAYFGALRDSYRAWK